MSQDLSGRKLGHYEIHEVIGRGGMGEVYRELIEDARARINALKGDA